MYSFNRRELARLPTPLPPSRLLGKFVEAAKDLRTACKIDFDDTADEWLKEVTPNVSENDVDMTFAEGKWRGHSIV